MCSSTRGPAIVPSLVTCPTSTSAKPRALASRISSKALARTWPTVPGALSSVSSHMVWIESITTSAASGAASIRRRDVAQIDRGGEFQLGPREPQPAGAQPHLLHRLLARNVQHPPPARRQRRGRLQQQR